MKVKAAINGFGRIGRMVFRKAMLDDQIQIVAVNASYPAETLAHLIKYDTNHGRYECDVTAEDDALIVNGKRVLCLIIETQSSFHGESLGLISSLKQQVNLIQKIKRWAI